MFEYKTPSPLPPKQWLTTATLDPNWSYECCPSFVPTPSEYYNNMWHQLIFVLYDRPTHTKVSVGCTVWPIGDSWNLYSSHSTGRVLVIEGHIVGTCWLSSLYCDPGFCFVDLKNQDFRPRSCAVNYTACTVNYCAPSHILLLYSYIWAGHQELTPRGLFSHCPSNN